MRTNSIKPLIPVMVKFTEAEFGKLESRAKADGRKPGPYLTLQCKKFLAKVASNRKGEK